MTADLSPARAHASASALLRHGAAVGTRVQETIGRPPFPRAAISPAPAG